MTSFLFNLGYAHIFFLQYHLYRIGNNIISQVEFEINAVLFDVMKTIHWISHCKPSLFRLVIRLVYDGMEWLMLTSIDSNLSLIPSWCESVRR